MVRQRIRKTLLLISFLLLPVTLYYFSPYLILMAAAEGIVAGSFIAFTLMFLASLVLGRAFCGWVCPIGGLGEICATIHEKRVNGWRADWIKYAVWVPWVALIAFTVVRAGGLRAVDGLYQTSYGISLIEPYAYVIYLTVIALVVVLSFTVGKRGFCHAVCWMAPFMILGSRIKNTLRWPSLHLCANRDDCIRCGSCDRACPMSLRVEAMVQCGSMRSDECILCGSCVDVCPKSVIRYRFRSPK